MAPRSLCIVDPEGDYASLQTLPRGVATSPAGSPTSRGDQPLAAEVREMEERFRRGEVVDVATALVEAVSMRYEVEANAGGGAG